MTKFMSDMREYFCTFTVGERQLMSSMGSTSWGSPPSGSAMRSV